MSLCCCCCFPSPGDGGRWPGFGSAAPAGGGQLRGWCCSVSVMCCLALGSLCSQKCCDACLTSKGLADGELEGRSGMLLCVHRVGSTPQQRG